jgi:hypothetical protein
VGTTPTTNNRTSEPSHCCSAVYHVYPSWTAAIAVTECNALLVTASYIKHHHKPPCGIPAHASPEHTYSTTHRHCSHAHALGWPRCGCQLWHSPAHTTVPGSVGSAPHYGTAQRLVWHHAVNASSSSLRKECFHPNKDTQHMQQQCHMSQGCFPRCTLR